MAMLRFAALGVAASFAFNCAASDLQLSGNEPLRLAPAGSYQLRVISPTILELTFVTAVKQGSDRPEQWILLNSERQSQVPGPDQFGAAAGTNVVSVKAVGFKLRVLYAPFKHWDLRIANYLYL